MGKLICDSTAPVSPWNDRRTTGAWEEVSGLDEQQKRHLQRLHTKGVLWKHPSRSPAVVFRLSHGGDVEADENCLFTASQKAMNLEMSAEDLRRRAVRRFVEDLGSESSVVDDAAIKHMYAPDLTSGWGIHVVQELKLLAKKADRQTLDSDIQELVTLENWLLNLFIKRDVLRWTMVKTGPSIC